MGQGLAIGASRASPTNVPSCFAPAVARRYQSIFRALHNCTEALGQSVDSTTPGAVYHEAVAEEDRRRRGQQSLKRRNMAQTNTISTRFWVPARRCAMAAAVVVEVLIHGFEGSGSTVSTIVPCMPRLNPKTMMFIR